jgi:hypothetical protein
MKKFIQDSVQYGQRKLPGFTGASDLRNTRPLTLPVLLRALPKIGRQEETRQNFSETMVMGGDYNRVMEVAK